MLWQVSAVGWSCGERGSKLLRFGRAYVELHSSFKANTAYIVVLSPPLTSVLAIHIHEVDDIRR